MLVVYLSSRTGEARIQPARPIRYIIKARAAQAAIRNRQSVLLVSLGVRKSAARFFNRLGLPFPSSGRAPRIWPCTPPGFLDPQVGYLVARVFEPPLQLGLHRFGEMSAFTADHPLGSLVLICSRHGASCASATELDKCRAVLATSLVSNGTRWLREVPNRCAGRQSPFAFLSHRCKTFAPKSSATA